MTCPPAGSSVLCMPLPHLTSQDGSHGGGDVIVGVDGRREGLDALALGERLATIEGRPLVVVVAYPYAPLSSRVLDAPTDAASAARALDEARRAVSGRDAELLAVPGSSPGRTLHEVAEARGAGVIVVGSSHRGPAGRLVLGGVTAETLRRAPCAVAVAPRGWADGPRSLGRIGVAVDGSDRDRTASALAVSLSERIRPPAAVQTIHVDGAARVEAQVHLEGDTCDALAAHSAELDLLVLGSCGRGRLAAVVLGSVAARLVGIARCPVLALPGQAVAGSTPAVEVSAIAAGS
jgi:nucleotide-binding universal stress UspA family protein